MACVAQWAVFPESSERIAITGLVGEALDLIPRAEKQKQYKYTLNYYSHNDGVEWQGQKQSLMCISVGYFNWKKLLELLKGKKNQCQEKR